MGDEEVDRLFNREKCDLLLGRKTYEIFAAYWPYYDESAEYGSIATLFNSITKYVVSRSGSTELVHALLENDLVDEMNTLTVPIVLGGGKKLFADGSAPHSYRLTRSRSSGTGIIVAHYERDGEIRIGDTASEQPSEAERARQERMKREG